MGLMEHARAELEMLAEGTHADDEDGCMQLDMNNCVLKIVKEFSTQGHSGFSAAYAIGMIEKLLRYEPLSPLTGEPSEWTVLEYGPEMAAQNKRCSHVFKRDDGTAYDIQGKVFREPNGASFTNGNSSVDITFPYTPTTEYVDVNFNGEPLMAEENGIHPAPAQFTPALLADDPILHYFHYAHLPKQLQEVSKMFCVIAAYMVTELPRNAERSAGLRKLLEAKDCAVRANVKPKVVRDLDDELPVEGEVKITGGDKSEAAIPFNGE